MFENVKELFEQYNKLNTPLIISAFVCDGRKVMFVVIGFKNGEVLGVSRDTRIPGHYNPNTVIEWRDYSNENANIISKQEAKDIYEKYVSHKTHTETSDEPQRSERSESNGAVEEHGTAVEAI